MECWASDMGGSSEEGRWGGRKRRWRGESLYLQNCVMENNNNKKEYIVHKRGVASLKIKSYGEGESDTDGQRD